MMNPKFLISIVLSIFAFFVNYSASQVTITCTVGIVPFIFFGKQSACTVKTITPAITARNTDVNRPANPITTAKILYANKVTMQFLPTNLQILIPDITGIRLVKTKLKEVTPQPLSTLPSLTMFASVDNDVSTIPAGLFDSNPDLVYISFKNNKLTQISAAAFNIPNKLHHLYLYPESGNCKLGNAITEDQVFRLIERIPNSNCGIP